MRSTLLIIICLLSLSTTSLSETLDDLIKRDGLYYKELSNVPFNGEVQGQAQGLFKGGSRAGLWKYYYENGQLRQKGMYTNGKKEGYWESFYRNGQLFYKGEYKNGKKVGLWESYYENETLFYKGEYKAGKEEGEWISFNPDGTVWEYKTGFFKNGHKISD